MRYFVIADDGQKYGPADVSTLQSWVAEGRLLPTQQVEEEGSGIRMAAAAVTGLTFPNQAQPGPYQAPNPGVAGQYRPTEPASPAGSNYNRPMAGAYGDDGKQDVTYAWVFFAIGLLCCGVVFLPISIVYANKALSKGNDGGNIAKILAIIFLVLNVIGVIAYIALFATAMKNGVGTNPPAFR